MRVIGGKRGPDGGLGAYVTFVEHKGPADSYGIVEGTWISTVSLFCFIFLDTICVRARKTIWRK